jgi:hypothetical protein
MAKIYKSDVIQKAVNELGIQVSSDKTPSETLDKIQCTYNLNRNTSNFVLSGSGSTTGAITINTAVVNTNSETWITGIGLGVVKDATCDIADGRINVTVNTIDGISRTIISIPVLTLTAQSENVFYSLPYPIRLQNNTAITTTNSFTVGKLNRSFVVFGYYTSS